MDEIFSSPPGGCDSELPNSCRAEQARQRARIGFCANASSEELESSPSLWALSRLWLEVVYSENTVQREFLAYW
jgi:hypothetical protein